VHDETGLINGKSLDTGDLYLVTLKIALVHHKDGRFKANGNDLLGMKGPTATGSKGAVPTFMDGV
jgi:hypothetical protein